MSQFRYVLRRVLGGLLALGLFALFLNALLLSQQQRTQSAVALSGPPPAVVPLGRFTPDRSGDEVNVSARIDAAIDVALPMGTGKLYLLTDPASPPATPPTAAILIPPAAFPAFETYLASVTRTEARTAPVVTLNGVLDVPFWIDRAEAAAADAKRTLPDDLVFIRPFLHGRAAGLAPPLLAWSVAPFLLFVLVAHLWAEARRVIIHRRTLSALAGLDSLHREAEATALLSSALEPGDRQWADIATRRHALRQRRAQLDASLGKEDGAGKGKAVWLAVAILGGLTGILPRRPLFDALATHVVGVDLRQVVVLPVTSEWSVALDSAMTLPGELLARSVIGLFGPQSVGVASSLRTMPFTVWIALAAVITLVMIRRAENRRTLRGHLR